MVGRTVGNYQIIEKLGAGGMGDIYKAQDPRLNRMVAIKVLSLASAGDPERRRRFVQEAQAASGLNHPNIITIYDIVSEGENEYMVMEYISGKTLVDVIPKGGLRLPQAIKYYSIKIEGFALHPISTVPKYSGSWYMRIAIGQKNLDTDTYIIYQAMHMINNTYRFFRFRIMDSGNICQKYKLQLFIGL